MKRSYRLPVFALLLIIFYNQAAAADMIAPLPVRNFDPVMMRFFDPTPDSALRSYDQLWSFELNQHYATMNNYDRLPDAQLLIDMELYQFDPVMRLALNDRFELSLRTPFIIPASGVFDDAIQTFHGWFNMPNGGRQNRPNNRYAYYLNHDKGAQWQARNRWEYGNVELSARYHLAGNKQWAMSALAALKLPTASKSRGWGSGAADIAAGFVTSVHQGDWSAHIEGWVILPLAKDEPGLHYKKKYLRGSLTGGYQMFDSIGLIVQAQGGNSPYRTTISSLDQRPFLISFGLRGVTSYGWGWSMAIVENITQVTTQDISITAGISWQVN